MNSNDMYIGMYIHIHLPHLHLSHVHGCSALWRRIMSTSRDFPGSSAARLARSGNAARRIGLTAALPTSTNYSHTCKRRGRGKEGRLGGQRLGLLGGSSVPAEPCLGTFQSGLERGTGAGKLWAQRSGGCISAILFGAFPVCLCISSACAPLHHHRLGRDRP